MKISDVFVSLLQNQSLNRAQSASAFADLLTGKLTPVQAKALLLLLARKGETAPEVLGCLQALRKLEPAQKNSIPDLMDTCGTGGDGSHSINISTLAALVIAGAGGHVAKHGNKGISSRCGSSDVLQALGVDLYVSIEKITHSIQKNGIGYFHAPAHHPVFSKVQPLRQELKVKTIFNLLGPLVNPLALKSQLVGVASKKVFELYVSILKQQKATALVCHSEGLDEISLTKPTEAAFIRKGNVSHFIINPKHYFKNPGAGSIQGGDAKTNARLAMGILHGKIKGKSRQMILLNAAAGLWICGKAASLKEGLCLAENSIDSGKAYQALCGLIRDQR